MLGILLVGGSAVAVGWLAGSSLERLAYDDASYLERGLYHARQIERHPPWQWPVRLPYSLSFEGPKPPWLHGWLAAIALAVGGRGRPEIWAGLATALPWGLLVGLVVWGSLRGSAGSWVAGAAGALALHALPEVVRLAPQVMVETWLTCWILAAVLLWEWWRRRPTAWGALLLGAAVSCALLVKLTALLFLAPLLLFGAGASLRRSGVVGKQVGQLLLVLLATGLVAGGWYLSWAKEAWRFGVWSARHEAWSDPRSLPSRLAGIPLEAAGMVALALLVALLLELRRQRFEPAELAALGALLLPSLLVVASSPQSASRFWAPGLGFLAVLGGRWVARASPRERVWGLVLLAAGAVLACGAIWRERSLREKFRLPELSRFLERQAATRRVPLTVCNLGNVPHWNQYRLRLAVELGSHPRNFDVLDFSVAPEEGTVRRRCELLFRLRPDEILPAQPEQVGNRQVGVWSSWDLAALGFRPLDAGARPADLWLPKEIWVRGSEDPGPAAPDS